jgi:acetyltransferase-like isoleucine patch superfamily enzyme
MVLRPLRQLSLSETSGKVFDQWLGEIEERLSDPSCDRYRLCRDVLCELYHPSLGNYDDVLSDPATPTGTKAVLLALDPHNITLEPEYYHEIEPERYARVKPLLWLWQSFDRSPLGGGNVDVGVRLRRILAKHIFGRCGKRFKCFQFVEFSFGYNIEVGDDVVVHRHVLSITNQVDVTDAITILEDGVRVTYHATVLAGVKVGAEAMIGAGAVATRDVRPYHVNLGIPAKSVRVKPNAPKGALEDTLEAAHKRELKTR